MRYDVLIVSDEQQQLRDFKKYASNLIKNVNITLSFEVDDIYDLIEYIDLIIIDPNVHSYLNLIENSLEKKIRTFFLTNPELHLEKYSAINKEDILYKPLNFDDLILKINHFINVSS